MGISLQSSGSMTLLELLPCVMTKHIITRRSAPARATIVGVLHRGWVFYLYVANNRDIGEEQKYRCMIKSTS
jgi:hypothetical protein